MAIATIGCVLEDHDGKKQFQMAEFASLGGPLHLDPLIASKLSLAPIKTVGSHTASMG
jgi:hypothetical protein